MDTVAQTNQDISEGLASIQKSLGTCEDKLHDQGPREKEE